MGVPSRKWDAIEIESDRIGDPAPRELDDVTTTIV